MKLLMLANATVLAGIVLSAYSIAPADAKVRPLTCKGGSVSIYQDASNAQVGIGRTPNFLRCSTPDFPGASVGMDVDGLLNQEFDALALTTRTSGAAINNTVVRFCFRDRSRNTFTVEKTIGSFEVRSDFRGYIERVIFRQNFNEPAVRDGFATLTRFTVVLKSGNQSHTLDLGRIFVESLSGFQPKDIENRDVGCDALECGSNPQKDRHKNLMRDHVERARARRQNR